MSRGLRCIDQRHQICTRILSVRSFDDKIKSPLCRMGPFRKTGTPCLHKYVSCSPKTNPENDTVAESGTMIEQNQERKNNAARKANLIRARRTYQFIAAASSLLMFGLASFATYFKFIFNKPKGSPFPWGTFAATLFVVICGTAFMEMYARWAHKIWWHDSSFGWALHKSHHKPRTGPFEANDIYAVANAIPAFVLCFIGFFSSGIMGLLMFGFGLGITLFGMAYMFVHDGLVHKRFPVGPLADVPFMKKVAAAHMLHHANKYGGKPYGMFLGPQEIGHIPEAVIEMDRIAATL